MSGTDERREWREVIDGLPREIAPGRDPWPDIAARIAAGERAPEAPRRERHWWPVAAAAALAGCIGLMLWSNAYQPPGEAPADVASTAGRVPAYAGSLQATALEYRAALRELEALQRQGVRRGEPVAVYADRGWSTMIEAEHELESALRRDPDDAYINERLVQLRARQLDMLRQIASAGMASRGQTI